MSHFQLPEWRQLSRDEQIEIVNLPTSRTYIVRGGPGTGKSILAIHRAAKLKDTQRDARIKMLVYNKPLQLHLSDALDAVGLDASWAETCHAWIRSVSGLAVSDAAGLWGYDWGKVRQEAKKRAKGGHLYSHLIIDEGQDIPQPLLEIFAEISETATIFVDDRQAISDEARAQGLVGIASIRAIFGPGQNTVFDLSRNFRNSQEILDAAHMIRPLESWELPDKAIRSGEPRPVILEAGIGGVVESVAIHLANSPEDRIGIAVPDRKIAADLKRKLETADVPVQLFGRGPYGRVIGYDPCAEGVTVLTYNVIKGLEFDAVFIPCLESQFFEHGDSETRRNMVYVAATRSRRNLIFAHTGEISASWLKSALDEACCTGIIKRH